MVVVMRDSIETQCKFVFFFSVFNPSGLVPMRVYIVTALGKTKVRNCLCARSTWKWKPVWRRQKPLLRSYTKGWQCGWRVTIRSNVSCTSTMSGWEWWESRVLFVTHIIYYPLSDTPRWAPLLCKKMCAISPRKGKAVIQRRVMVILRCHLKRNWAVWDSCTCHSWVS